jgi:hypothetical protein
MENISENQFLRTKPLHPKTLEEHRDYLYQIVLLKLFFMHHWLAGHPLEKPVDVLRNRIDIYRKTDANPYGLSPAKIDWDAPDWQVLEQALLQIYDRCHQDVATFEKEGFAVLRTSIDARVERDFRDTSHLGHYQCGSLRHNVHDAPLKEVGFHIANRISPKSIFDDRLYLPCCFMVLMKHVEVQYQAEFITTGTWLNSNSKWLSLFPQEWHDNLGEPESDVQWHYGYWGQFITARGTFNGKLGEYTRQNGKLKYYPRASKCSIFNMRRHITETYFFSRSA